MKVLITGAGGQIGRDLIKAYAADGATVIATDARVPESPSAGASWHRLDVTEAAAVEQAFADHKPDLVVHLAAILSATGETNHVAAYNVNQTGTWNVLEAARKTVMPRVLFTSTIAVFGPGLADPTPDDVPLRPTTMYGVTKVAGELLCDYFRSKFGLDVRGVRFPGLISGTKPGGGSSDYAVHIYYDGVRTGRYQAFCRADTRIPLMFMPDGVRALRELAAAPRERLTRAIYNIAAFSPRADEIATSAATAIAGLEVTFVPDPMRQGILDSWPRALDDGLARRDWGWAPRYDLAAMTRELVAELRQTLIAS